MDNHQSELADRILERISTDKAVHDAFQRLLEEMQGFREEINQLRQEMASPGGAKYLTVAQAAETLGISEETVRRRVRTGKWPAWRDGQAMRFGSEEMEAIRELGKPKAPRPRRSNLERRLFREKYLQNHIPQ